MVRQRNGWEVTGEVCVEGAADEGGETRRGLDGGGDGWSVRSVGRKNCARMFWFHVIGECREVAEERGKGKRRESQKGIQRQ